MALANFTHLLILLSQMQGINKNLLLQHKNELLSFLSSLGDMKDFNALVCFNTLNNIPQSYFKKINLNDTNKQEEFCKNIFIILKNEFEFFKLG